MTLKVRSTVRTFFLPSEVHNRNPCKDKISSSNEADCYVDYMIVYGARFTVETYLGFRAKATGF